MSNIKWWEWVVLAFIKPTIGIDCCPETGVWTVTLIKQWRGYYYMIDQFETKESPNEGAK